VETTFGIAEDDADTERVSQQLDRKIQNTEELALPET